MTGFGQTSFDWNIAGERTTHREQRRSVLCVPDLPAR